MAFQASWLQQQLGAELLTLREAKNLTTREVGRSLGWAASKVARMERAENRIDPQDIIKLGRLYEIPDSEVTRLCEMARASRTDIWWERYKTWLSDSYYAMIGLENDATRIKTTHPSIVPGLLQTRRYIEGLFASNIVVTDPDRVTVLSEVRQLRQRRLTEPSNPLELVAIIPESVLYASFGGEDAMREQLGHLRTMMELPNVDVRVLPTARPVARLPLSLFEFGSEEGPAIAISDTDFGHVFYDTPMEILQTRRIVNHLHDLALGPGETVSLIEQRIREIS